MSLGIVKSIQNLFHIIISDAKTALVNYIEPGLELLTQSGGVATIQKAETYLSGLAAGNPWAATIDGFIVIAGEIGVTLTKEAAGAILNYAQTNIIAKNAGVPPVNPMAIQVAQQAAATPVPVVGSAS